MRAWLLLVGWPTRARRTALTGAALLLAPAAEAQVRLPRLVNDGLVLQRAAPVPLWGWASPGEPVTLTVAGHTYPTAAGPDGKWTLTLPALPAGGPYELDFRASNRLTVKDVLVCDVWVCAGQSNMAFVMSRLQARFPAAVAQATNPRIRQFKVPPRYVFTAPLADLAGGRWEAATPQSVLDFTAVGYFFAQALFEKYLVPIGLVNTSWGGTPAEAWLSAAALRAFPAYAQVAARFADSTTVGSVRRQDEAAGAAWSDRLRRLDQGLVNGHPAWAAPESDVSAGPTLAMPGYWAEAATSPVHGAMWLRKEIDVPAALAGRPAQLLLCHIVNQDSTYLNGHLVGSVGNCYLPRRYPVPAALLRPGRNVRVVRVVNSHDLGGVVRDKTCQLVAGGQVLDLRGLWQYRLGAAADPNPATIILKYQPGGLFNGMVAPLLSFAIRGVAWYQGESNTSKAAEYGRLFPALIADWRQQWQRSALPFVFVQLANFVPTTQQQPEDWPALREALRRTLVVPHTGMAVTIDVGEWNDIHPLDKQTVGKRTAYADRQVVASGPLYQGMRVTRHQAMLTFADVGGGLVARGGGAELHGFEVTGADQQFVAAQARVVGRTVVVSSTRVPVPVAVRYAWAANPTAANLYNREGLSASPFRTDR